MQGSFKYNLHILNGERGQGRVRYSNMSTELHVIGMYKGNVLGLMCAHRFIHLDIFVLTTFSEFARTTWVCFKKQVQRTMSLILYSALISSEWKTLCFWFQNSWFELVSSTQSSFTWSVAPLLAASIEPDSKSHHGTIGTCF